jgi:hypothetical protein
MNKPYTYDAKASEAMSKKLDIIKSFLGNDPDTALTVLTYALVHTGFNHGAEFHSIVKNLSLIWEHVKSQLEEDEGDDHESE